MTGLNYVPPVGYMSSRMKGAICCGSAYEQQDTVEYVCPICKQKTIYKRFQLRILEEVRHWVATITG